MPHFTHVPDIFSNPNGMLRSVACVSALICASQSALPHQAANYNQLMVRILTQDCDSVQTRKSDLAPSVCAIVDACLKRERDERTSNAGVLATTTHN